MRDGPLAGARVLVLGAGGFIGRSLCRELVRLGVETHALDRGDTPEEMPHSVVWRSASLESRELRSAVRNKDFIFYVAGSSNPAQANRNPAGDVLGSLVPMLRLLDTCREAFAGRLVFASSGGAVYGVTGEEPIGERHPTEPITAYGIDKLAAEKFLDLYHRLHGLDAVALRISNPYGPFHQRERTQGAVGSMMWNAMTGKPLRIYGDGSVVRDFIYVGDVAAAFVAAATYSGPSRIFNVGSGEGRALRDVAKDVLTVAAAPNAGIEYQPVRAADVPVNILDSSLFKDATGWTPATDWTEGLVRTSQWIAGELRRNRPSRGFVGAQTTNPAILSAHAVVLRNMQNLPAES